MSLDMFGQSAPWQVHIAADIVEGESLDGYVARIAAANYFPRLAEITQVAGAEATSRPHASHRDAAMLDVLAECLRIDPAVLRHHAPIRSSDAKEISFFGTQVSHHFLQFTLRRFSPSALAISPHHRALWQSRILPICTETWEYLQDRCPNPACLRRQGWRRTQGIDLCDACAEPLTRAQAEPVPSELRPHLEMLVGLVHPDPVRRGEARARVSPNLSHLSPKDLLELACALAPIVDPRAGAPLQLSTLSRKIAAEVTVPALARTWPFLSDWPHALERYLLDRLNSSGRSMGAAKWDVVRKLFSGHRRNSMSAAVAAVIDSFGDSCRAAVGQGLTVAQAMEATGGRQKDLCRMRRAGELPSRLALSGSRFQVLIDEASLMLLVENNRPRERLTRAAERLGVPTYAVHQLARAGLLEAAVQPPGRTGQFDVYKSSLEGLYEAIQAKLVDPNPGEEHNLAEIMKTIGGRAKPWARVIRALLAGELQVSLGPGSEPLARRLTVSDKDVLSLPLFSEPDGMDWQDIRVTKGDLADMMNILPHNFSGYSEFLLGPGEHVRDISMREALELACTYINTGEIGRRLGIHFTSARRQVERLGLKPECGGLYDRAVVEELLPQLGRSMTSGQIPTRLTRKQTITVASTMHSIVYPDGKLRLPAYLRRQLGLELGGKVEFEQTPAGIIMRSVAERRAAANPRLIC